MRKIFQLVLCLVVVAACMGCSVKQPAPLFEQPGLAARIRSGEHVQAVDNFLILMDTSHTMRDTYKGEQKFYLAQSAALSLNETIAGLKLNGGLRTFGDLSMSAASRTKLICPVQPYSAEAFAGCINDTEASFGSTPLGEALAAAADDIEGLPGKTAIIIISDGNFTGQNPAEAVNMLKDKYGDNVCISSITIGRVGTLNALTRQIGCGLGGYLDDVKTADGMADFAVKVFFEKGVAKPAPAPAKIIINSVLFDFDSSTVKPEAVVVIQQAAEMLQQNADSSVVIEGYTCSVGPEAYNQGLSERRATAVKAALVDQGIDASRLTAKGMGEDNPVADNTTKDGRERNRRVEFQVIQ
jgi:OOP family OmpA-OmpF porin